MLSAGTLGTTNLLLRNRSAFPRISRKLGTRFCGNGDLLTLALNCAEVVDGVRVPRIVDPGYGPVITSTARVPDALDGGEGRGFYLQDAGYPQHLAWILHVLAAPQTLWHWRDARLLPGQELAARARPTPTSPATSPTCWSRPSCRPAACRCWAWAATSRTGACTCARAGWTSTGRREKSNAYFERLRTTSRGVARTLGGRFADNPIWFLRRVITVHPLGGAPMGRFASEGVVDPYGNVFGYPGLLRRRRLGHARAGRPEPELHDRRARRPLRRPHPRDHPGRGGRRHMTASVRFTEEMLGHVTFGEEDFMRGAVPERDGAGALKFHLTIVVDDIDRFGVATRAATPARTATWCATRSAASCRSSTAPSTCSSTPSRASSACSTGCSSATAPATRSR